MAPTLSGKENLEDTIAKVYETLRRTENRTLETKRRAAKTLEDSSQHLSSSLSRNPDQFLESLNYNTDYTNKHVNHVSVPRYSTLGSRRTQHPIQIKPSPHAKKVESGKKTAGADNTNKVRNIIFKTLDRLFQIPNKPSLKSPKQSPISKQGTPVALPVSNYDPSNSVEEKSLSLETFKLLNQNTTDTLPRDHSVVCGPVRKNENVDLRLYDSAAFSSDESSSDDETWEFIPAPLKFEQVALEDTLEFPSNPTDIEGDQSCRQVPQNETLKKKQKNRYQRKAKRGSERNKIQKKAQERQTAKKTEISKLDSAVLQLYDISRNIQERRADSPIQKRKTYKRNLAPAFSLPNLIALQECDSTSSTLSDCGTDTFARNIAYCASSTLSKSIPSFSENHINEDDACSSSSSFSSLQRMHYSTNESTSRSTHESTLREVPSALCGDVLVTPITVPINHFGEIDSRTTGITPESFKELTEIYRPKTNYPNQHAASAIHEKNVSLGNQAQPKIQNTDSINDDVSVDAEIGHDSAIKFETINLSSSNVSLNPPPPPPRMPPPPPPPPLSSFSTNATVRGLLPLPIFTQPQMGKSIFTEMKQISIDEGDIKRLKENFPLKTGLGCKRLKRFLGRDQSQELTSEEKKFLHHIELFLKRYRISDFQPLVQSINTIDAGNPELETEWFSTLIQCIPKEEEIEKIQKGKRFQKPVAEKSAKKFATDLLNIENLHGKLGCIQFSLDFNESSTKVFKWANSFTQTCDEIKNSDKFVKLINVIRGLLQISLNQSLKPGEHSKIYGFDIHGLTKLATSKSADGSSTYLQFVIEYILSNPELSDSVDVYKAFADLGDMTKTSIQEIRAQYDEWKEILKTYNVQYHKIKEVNQEPSFKMEYATRFRETTEEILRKLDEKLTEAQQSFRECKELFGLMNSETTEVMFFESLSNFFTAYQKTYNEIVERMEKANKQATIGKRTSLDGTSLKNSENSNDAKPTKDMIKQRKPSGIEFRSKIPMKKETVNDKRRSFPINHNFSRRTSDDFQDILDSSTTGEVGKGLMGLLMKKDDNIKRSRKSGGNSSSKLQIGLCREK